MMLNHQLPLKNCAQIQTCFVNASPVTAVPLLPFLLTAHPTSPT